MATESHTQPTIGDILLAHGFVSREDLAAAIEEQQRSEQPLGQILVTRGSITRLELASALAEQWSMAPTPERPGMDGSGRPSVVIDDDTYAVRVQSAVTDLARRVGAAEPLLAEIERRAADFISPQELEARLHDVRASIDLSLGRIVALESGLGTIAERLEEMTDGVEQAFAGMQAGTAELAERLAAVAASLDQLPEAGELSALGAMVASLADRPQIGPELPGRVGEIAAQVELGMSTIADLRAGLAELAARPSAEETFGTLLEELERRITLLADDSANDDRLAHVEARLAELAAAEARLVELEQQSAAAPDENAINALRAELDELGGRPVADPELEQRFEERLHELEQGLVDVHNAATADLQTDLHSLAARVAEAADGAAVQELEARVAELSDRPVADTSLAGRLDELAAEIDALRATPPPEAMPDPRIETLAEAIEGLGSQLESVAALVGTGERGPEIDELRGALDELARRRTGDDDTLHQLEALAGQVIELAARPDRADAVAGRVDELDMALQSAATAADVAVLRAQLDELAARPVDTLQMEDRVSELAARIEGLAAMPRDAPLEGLREEIERYTHDAIAATEERSAAAVRAAEASSLEIERLSTRLHELSAVPERASRGEPETSTARSDSTTERELERQRMAIERLSLHLGEHERALAEMMRSRGLSERLDALAARVEELSAAGTGNGAVPAAAGVNGTASSPELHAELRALVRRIDEAEASVQADREKQLTRLDRMASSIDWRLQRLEAGGTPEG